MFSTYLLVTLDSTFLEEMIDNVLKMYYISLLAYKITQMYFMLLIFYALNVVCHKVDRKDYLGFQTFNGESFSSFLRSILELARAVF